MTAGTEIRNSGALSLGGNITGAQAITKNGNGNLTLSGATNGSTTTTVNAGTLQIGSGSTTGRLGSGTVTNNGTLVFNRSDSYGGTVSNVISGNGSVSVSAGSLSLSGNNTYSGTTTVNAGTLLIEGFQSGNGTVTVKSGATFGGDGSTAGSLVLEAGANFAFSLTKTFTVNGANVTFGGLSIANITGLDSSVAGGTYTLINGTAAFDFTNVSNVGLANAANIGGGKSAYFQNGSLDVIVVVPEAKTWVLIGIGSAFMLWNLRRKRRV